MRSGGICGTKQDGANFIIKLYTMNTINLPEGTYEVNVNGTVGTFEIPLY